MIRDKKLQKKRKRFVKLAANDPRKAARHLRDLSFSLGETKTHKDVIFALSQIFCVSEKTIMRDLLNDTDT